MTGGGVWVLSEVGFGQINQNICPKRIKGIKGIIWLQYELRDDTERTRSYLGTE